MKKNRYKRIEELGWSMELLQNTTAMVVGAGALGNEVLKNLALLGVGNILVADMDVIEDHNLTRTVLFREGDIGRYKVEVAAERLREMNPDIKITSVVGKVQDVFGRGIYRHVDVVFGCLDNIQGRIDINRYCYQTQTLFIDAGLRKLDGDVKIFAPPFDVCLDCTLNEQLRETAWRRFSCLKLRHRGEDEDATIPTSPTISSIMAGLQVQLAIKYLHGGKIPVDYRMSVYGFIDEMNVSKMSFNPVCPTHNLYDPIIEEDITQLPHRSDELKVGELLQIIKTDLGETATISLDYDLITRLACNTHQSRCHILRKRGDLYVDEAECPNCIADGLSSVHSLMREYFVNQLDGQETEHILNSTLEEIGTPLYQIFKVKAIVNDELIYRYYEMSGDKERILGVESQVMD
ncbi:MAG: ThiF family adenylyltransferase [Chitinophagales bacterium]